MLVLMNRQKVVTGNELGRLVERDSTDGIVKVGEHAKAFSFSLNDPVMRHASWANTRLPNKKTCDSAKQTGQTDDCDNRRFHHHQPISPREGPGAPVASDDVTAWSSPH